MLELRPLENWGQSKVPWGLVKWHHVALWTRSLRFESLIPSLETTAYGRWFVSWRASYVPG